jgi:predicted NBD/HSP70 family sugar kinase
VSNERAILRELLTGGPATQSELARRTKLSNASVSSIVRSLRERGMVLTGDTVSSGRKATLVSPRLASRRVAVGIDIGRSHAGLVLAQPGMEVLVERRIPLATGLPAEEVLHFVRDLLTEGLASEGRSDADVAAVVVAIPGPVDAASGRVLDGTILPEWLGRTAADVERGLGLEVELANDADAGALAERSWGAAVDERDYLFVKIGTGIGAGIVVNGGLYTGAFGIAGELGHSTVDPAGSHCRCGNRGCLETVAATPVILEHLSEALRTPVTRDDLIRLAREGHRPTLRVLQDAGQALGQSIASAVNFLGPKLVVVGGTLSETGEVLIEAIRHGFARFAIPSVAERTRLELSTLGEIGGARGAAALAFENADELAYLVDVVGTDLSSRVDSKTARP